MRRVILAGILAATAMAQPALTPAPAAPASAVFAVQPDGTLAGGRVLAEVKTPDGMKVDRAGRLFVTSGDGVVVLAAGGQRDRPVRRGEEVA